MCAYECVLYVCACTVQWQSVLFKMREGKSFLWAWPYFCYSILEDCRIPFIQLNVTPIGLGYDMIPKCSLYPTCGWLQPSLWIKVYNVCAQVERNLSHQGDRHWHIQYRLAQSYLHLADLGCNHWSNRCKQDFLLDSYTSGPQWQ
jgi:hypothetical protein